MRTIRYSMGTNIPHQFTLEGEVMPYDTEIDEHFILEDDTSYIHVHVMGIHANGDVLVNLKSYKEHPSITLQKGIDLLNMTEQSFLNQQIKFQFEKTLHDWHDKRINLQALNTMSNIANALLTEEHNTQLQEDKT